MTSLVQPFLFLFILGTGLSSAGRPRHAAGLDFKTFIYPGVLAMSVLFTAIFSAALDCLGPGVRVPAGDPGRPGQPGLDRHRQVPGRRHDRHLPGRDLPDPGRARARALQPGADPHLIGELLLLSFTLTAFGVMMAARISQFQAFMALTQMLVMPLFFLSGALYPLSGLPAWLSVLTRIDPLTYVVGPMRHAVFSHLSFPPAFSKLLAPDITWGGWPVPLWLSLAMVAVMGLG